MAENALQANFTSLPATSKVAFQIARDWHHIDPSIKDDDVLAQGLITPDQILMIMQIIQEVMKCLSNSKLRAFQRAKMFANAKPLDRLADAMRLHSFINNWADRLAQPRESGDVVMIREAIISNVNGMQQKDFEAVQAEVLFYVG